MSDKTFGLTLSGDIVVEMSLGQNAFGFPPSAEQVSSINDTIQLLARAAKGVLLSAESDRNNSDYLMQPIEGIVDAIAFFSQLSQAIQGELNAGSVPAQVQSELQADGRP